MLSEGFLHSQKSCGSYSLRQIESVGSSAEAPRKLRRKLQQNGFCQKKPRKLFSSTIRFRRKLRGRFRGSYFFDNACKSKKASEGFSSIFKILRSSVGRFRGSYFFDKTCKQKQASEGFSSTFIIPSEGPSEAIFLVWGNDVLIDHARTYVRTYVRTYIRRYVGR